MRIRQRRYMFGLASVFLLVIAVSGAIAIRASGSPAVDSDVAAIRTFGDPLVDYENGKTVARTFENAPQGIVIGKVGDEPLFLAEFLQSMNGVESNLDYMRGQIAGGGRFSDVLQARTDLIEEAGISNVALSSLIMDSAISQRALAQGYGVTEDEVAEHISTMRAAVEQGNVNSSLLGYIETIGRDRYLNEILPIEAPAQLAVANMSRSVTWGLSNDSRKKFWNDLQQEAVEQAKIEVFREDLIAPANVQNALAYLEKYWVFDGGTK